MQVAWCRHRAHHHRLRENQIPIALAALPAPNFPRLRALALFGRRPPQRVVRPSCRRPKTHTWLDDLVGAAEQCERESDPSALVVASCTGRSLGFSPLRFGRHKCRGADTPRLASFCRKTSEVGRSRGSCADELGISSRLGGRICALFRVFFGVTGGMRDWLERWTRVRERRFYFAMVAICGWIMCWFVWLGAPRV
jgi:hypothetical protein